MKIMLTGVNGQVGWELRRTLATLGVVVAPTRAQLDLNDTTAIRKFLLDVRPDIIVNPAAYTAVDKAESEPDMAHAINAVAPAVMAETAKKINAAIVHFSTDYVFDGTKTGAYLESDLTHPLGVYGKTKLEGEQAILSADIPHLILRTSWVYGLRGGNFLLTMRRLFKDRDTLNVVNDQYGAPTWSRMIAEATAQILSQRPFPESSGTYHLTNAGNISWYDFAQAILARSVLPEGKQVTIHAIPAAQYPTPATRPANSVLASAKIQSTFGIIMPDWEAALDRCLER